ncbi:hypothetical protein [Paraflavitalea sp. CAU 1676]|uniref:hypothetical protein n=1 Tax=Paraflavitalea sp. CAU 1676 TaxID=3032598 RepID=UPI0023D9AE67|nr:hypothetical protein [Paraflavitalea sp. CAU 1676]MDF2189148.1 hypothetical protein [Paraflavitalea sp. CAU 1676]
MRLSVHDATAMRQLIYKLADGECTPQEKSLLQEFMSRSPSNEELVDLLTTEEGTAKLLREQAESEKIWAGHHLKLRRRRRKRRKMMPFGMQLDMVTLIALLLLVGATVFMVYMYLGKI